MTTSCYLKKVARILVSSGAVVVGLFLHIIHYHLLENFPGGGGGV